MASIAFDERLMRRAGGASLVLLLHAIAIVFLLRATLTAVHVGEASREGIVWFILPHRPKDEPVRVISVPGELPHSIFTYRGISIPSQRTGNAIAHGLHAMLFDCAPENLANLSPDERTQCANAPAGVKPGDSEVYAEHATRSHDATLWARGRSRKDQPLLLPCASPYSAGIGLGTVICVAHGLIHGFDLDNQPGYGDVPQQVGVPNGGDPPSEPAR